MSRILLLISAIMSIANISNFLIGKYYHDITKQYIDLKLNLFSYSVKKIILFNQQVLNIDLTKTL